MRDEYSALLPLIGGVGEGIVVRAGVIPGTKVLDRDCKWSNGKAQSRSSHTHLGCRRSESLVECPQTAMTQQR